MIDWAIAARTLAGEDRSGDAHLVKPFDGGVLVAAIDGLGHGELAADAAELAVASLARDPSADVKTQLISCHERLKGTRGAVVSLARCDAVRSELVWSGVGNIEGVLMRIDPMARPRHETLLVFGGVVGGALAGVRSAALPLCRGDVLVFATDGVRPDFSFDIDLLAPVKEIADGTLLRWGRDTDDALVLAARWQGVTA